MIKNPTVIRYSLCCYVIGTLKASQEPQIENVEGRTAQYWCERGKMPNLKYFTAVKLNPAFGRDQYSDTEREQLEREAKDMFNASFGRRKARKDKEKSESADSSSVEKSVSAESNISNGKLQIHVFCVRSIGDQS